MVAVSVSKATVFNNRKTAVVICMENLKNKYYSKLV